MAKATVKKEITKVTLEMSMGEAQLVRAMLSKFACPGPKDVDSLRTALDDIGISTMAYQIGLSGSSFSLDND